MDFKVDPKLWDSLNDDQKALLKSTLTQHESVVKKDIDAEVSKRVEKEKETIKNQLTEEQKAQAEKDNFLSSVPEDNREKVSKMLDKGFTQEDITKDYADLVKKPEKQMPDLESIVNGKIPADVKADVPDQEAKDKALIEEVETKGLPRPKDQYDKETISKWERYDQLKKDGKIK